MDSSKSKVERVRTYLEEALSKGLGLDLSKPSLKETPNRIAKMWVNEFCANIGKEFPEKDLTSFDPDEEPVLPALGSDHGIVVFDHIPFVSLCSHHFLPFSGQAWFLYIPGDFLVGASKPTRLIQFYSAKPSMQESIGREVVNRFVQVIKPKGVMIVMRAVHGCMACRGVRNGSQSGMITSVRWGGFEKQVTRSEGMQLIMLSTQSGV